MTDTSTPARRSESSTPRGGNPVTRLFSSLSLFVRQIIDELRKVVRPSREELVQYTIVVIVFVCAIMALVSILDFASIQLVKWVFGG